jgi:hypothetical protein
MRAVLLSLLFVFVVILTFTVLGHCQVECETATIDPQGKIVFVPVDCDSVPQSQQWRNLSKPVPQTTCTKSNGKPCPKWEHWLIGQYPPKPVEKEEIVIPIKRDGFFAYRKNHDSPRLHPNKKSWAIFIGAHAALATVLSYDLAAAHHPCPCEEAHSEIPAMAGVTALDTLMFLYWSPAMSVEGASYGFQHYLRDTLK